MKFIIQLIIIFYAFNLSAADDLFILGEKSFNGKANCAFCHGVFGNGKGHPRSPGIAANLRETQLDEDLLIDTVSCGIPGSSMPFFNRKAYKDPEVCWETVMSDYSGRDVPKKSDKTVSEQKIKAIVHYILVNFKDRGKVTKEECVDKFGVGHSQCNKYE